MAVTGHRAAVADSVPDADTVFRVCCAQSASAPSVSTDHSGADVGANSSVGVLRRPGARCSTAAATNSAPASPPHVDQRPPRAFGSGTRSPGLSSSTGEGEEEVELSLLGMVALVWPCRGPPTSGTTARRRRPSRDPARPRSVARRPVPSGGSARRLPARPRHGGLAARPSLARARGTAPCPRRCAASPPRAKAPRDARLGLPQLQGAGAARRRAHARPRAVGPTPAPRPRPATPLQSAPHGRADRRGPTGPTCWGAPPALGGGLGQSPWWLAAAAWEAGANPNPWLIYGPLPPPPIGPNWWPRPRLGPASFQPGPVIIGFSFLSIS